MNRLSALAIPFLAAPLAGCGSQSTGSNSMSVSAGDANATGSIQNPDEAGGGNSSSDVATNGNIAANTSAPE